MSTLIEIKNLSVEIMSTRGLIHAVRGVNLSIEKGSVHGIVGESGCGKSVTAKTIMQLHEKRLVRAKGEINFEGRNIIELKEREMQNIRGAKIGMIFQDPMTALNPLFTIGDQISEVFVRHFHDDKKTAKKKSLELLERVGIFPAETRYNQYPFEFSGGMLQRVVIAIAVAANPELVIADEPTTALDVTIQAQILELLKELQKENKMSILLITHNFGIVSEMCDYVSVMYAGTILETGTKAEIFNRTANPYSRALIDSIPKRGHAGEMLETIPGIPPELFDDVPGCPFAPRCKVCTEKCYEVKPHLMPLDSNIPSKHLAACHNIGGAEL